MKGQHDQAIKDLDEAIKLKPNNAFACAVRGAAYIVKGMKDIGIKDLEKALSMDPNYKWAKDQLAKAR